MAVSSAGNYSRIREFVHRSRPPSNEGVLRAREQIQQSERASSPPEAKGLASPSTSPASGPAEATGRHIDFTA